MIICVVMREACGDTINENYLNGTHAFGMLTISAARYSIAIDAINISVRNAISLKMQLL